MGLMEIVFQGPTPAQIGSVTLDASVKELHKASAKATRHPVESEAGFTSNISDNVHIDPLSIQIEGVVSGHPTLFLVAIARLFAGGAKDPVSEAHLDLLSDLLSGRLITVVTTLLEYPDMVLEDVEVTRDAKKGNSLYFRATATMITLVTLETVETGGSGSAGGGATKSGGSSPPKEASAGASTKSRTFLSKITGITRGG